MPVCCHICDKQKYIAYKPREEKTAQIYKMAEPGRARSEETASSDVAAVAASSSGAFSGIIFAMFSVLSSDRNRISFVFHAFKA